MGRASKGGRRKNLWDVKATVHALDRLLGKDEDPGETNPERSFLHFIRALCRNLDANMAAITAFDRLLRLMREKAGPIRRYAHDVNAAYTAHQPLAPVMNELLKRGEADELWKLWFFACEMPNRLRSAISNVDRLLYAAGEFMPAPFVVPGFQLVTARAAVLLGLRSFGYDLDRIAALLDPIGHKQNAKAARDRIRKEVRRLDVMIARGKRVDAKAAVSTLLPPVAPSNDRSDDSGRPPTPSPAGDKTDA